MAESDIDVDVGGIGTVAGQIQSQYSSIESELNRLKIMCSSVSNYWEATEATKFVEDFQAVNDKYDAFAAEYNNFMNSLSTFSGTYDDEEAAIIEAIGSSTAGGGN